MKVLELGGDELMHALRGGMDGGGRPEPRKAPLPEAQIMMLRELAQGYRAALWKPGDLVTVRAGVGGVRGAGVPHLVLETNYGCEPVFDSNNPGSMYYGSRPEVRVLTWMEDNYVAFWLENWVLEAYKGDTP